MVYCRILAWELQFCARDWRVQKSGRRNHLTGLHFQSRDAQIWPHSDGPGISLEVRQDGRAARRKYETDTKQYNNQNTAEKYPLLIMGIYEQACASVPHDVVILSRAGAAMSLFCGCQPPRILNRNTIVNNQTPLCKQIGNIVLDSRGVGRPILGSFCTEPSKTMNSNHHWEGRQQHRYKLATPVGGPEEIQGTFYVSDQPPGAGHSEPTASCENLAVDKGLNIGAHG